MLPVLVLLFILLPFVELTLLLRFADRFGWQSVLALVILTGVVGAWLARHQGLKTARRIQSELAAGQVPGAALWDAALIFVAGVLLVTPGLITDCCGILLLLPPVRAWLRRRLQSNFASRFQVMKIEGTRTAGGTGTAVHDEDPRRPEEMRRDEIREVSYRIVEDDKTQ